MSAAYYSAGTLKFTALICAVFLMGLPSFTFKINSSGRPQSAYRH
jgi:hypothetical protein